MKKKKKPKKPPVSSYTIDLHGYSVQDAFAHISNIIANRDTKSIRVITGKGKIQQEFPHWMNNHLHVLQYFPSSDGGSFIVLLKSG